MKLLFFCDAHLAERPPLARAPSYVDDIFAKLEELREIAETCDVTVFGGDLFHWPRPNETSHRLVRRVIDLFRRWPHDVWCVAGNHDLPPEMMAGLDRMPLGVVLEAGDVPYAHGLRLLHEDMLIGDPTWLQLSPLHWQHDLTERPDLFEVEREADLVIKVCHAMLMPGSDEGWPFPALGIQDIKTDADIVLIGHPHWKTGVHIVNDTMFIGPGAVARTSRGGGEMERTPMAYVLEYDPRSVLLPALSWTAIDAVTVSEVRLQSVRPASEVFAYGDIPTVGKDGLFAGYVNALETALPATEEMSIEDAIKSISGQVDEEVMRLAKGYLEKAGL